MTSLPEKMPTNNETNPPVHEGSSALEHLGIDEQAIANHRKELKAKEYNRGVCVCGHAMNKHTKYGINEWSCQTARMWCPCEAPKVIVEVSDTRYFMTKSRGYGEKHALSTGLSRLHEKGGTSKLVIEPKCFRCEEVKYPLVPAAFDRHIRLIFKPGPYNGLFCRDCLSIFPIDHYSK